MDLEKETIYDTDVLVMGTDGLWDVSNNDKVADVVHNSLEQFPSSDEARYRYRFTSAAQDLVMSSRGKLNDRSWRTSDNKSATIDDISVFVIPLSPYKEEWKQWKRMQSPATQPAADNAIQPSGYVSFGNHIANSISSPAGTASSTPVDVQGIPIEELKATAISSDTVEEIIEEVVEKILPEAPVKQHPLEIQQVEKQTVEKQTVEKQAIEKQTVEKQTVEKQTVESVTQADTATVKQLPLDNQDEDDEELLVAVIPEISDPTKGNHATETDQQS